MMTTSSLLILLVLFFLAVLFFALYKIDDLKKHIQFHLTDSSEKNSNTFNDVITRLALIDQAQQKMSELSGEVFSLNMLLNDKKTRGAFGEVQLANIIRNMLPEAHFQLQAELPNGTRVDCLLLLPEPTGKLAIDAKFPLENYRRYVDAPPEQKKPLEQAFIRDMKKHIDDIAQKYIIPGITSNGAVLFLPAEAIFADIHNHFYDLIDYAQKKCVWLTSPTTMMAVLTTAQAVLKDQATQKHVHLIREHLLKLGEDFERFQRRMDQLQRHIEQANDDVHDVNISAKKITDKFNKIEKVDI
jgi:DNA recombination protein RmuC